MILDDDLIAWNSKDGSMLFALWAAAKGGERPNLLIPITNLVEILAFIEIHRNIIGLWSKKKKKNKQKHRKSSSRINGVVLYMPEFLETIPHLPSVINSLWIPLVAEEGPSSCTRR